MADIFVDATATYHGDGTDYLPALGDGLPGPYKTILGIPTPNPGDFVWIRRYGYITLTTAFAPNWAGVHIVGWPEYGDIYFDVRPAGAATYWDSDNDNTVVGLSTAKFTTSDTAHNFAPVGDGITCHRLWVDSSLTTAGTTPLGVFAGASPVHEKVAFTYSGATAGTSAVLRCYQNTGTGPKIAGLTCQGASTGAASTSICAIDSGASEGLVSGVQILSTFLQRGAASDTEGALVVGNTAGYKPLAVNNVTFWQMDSSPSAHQGSALVIASGSALVNDVAFNGPTGGSYEGPGVFINGSNCRLYDLWGAANVGCVYNAGSNNFVEVKNWTVNYAMAASGVSLADYRAGGTTPPLVIAGNNSSHGNTFSVFNGILGVATGQPKIGNLGANNVCLLNFTDYQQGAVYRTGGSPEFDYEVFSANQGPALGPWGYENRHGTLSANNAYRTGGANYSLRCAVSEVDAGQNRRALTLSGKGRECLTVKLVSGANTITLYGAHKGYSTAPTCDHIGFELDYFDSSGNPLTASSLTNDGTALTADASAWIYDTGLTAFSVSMTLPDCAPQVVPINLIVSPEGDTSGYFYTDPVTVVT